MSRPNFIIPQKAAKFVGRSGEKLMNLNPIVHTFKYGRHTITLETGAIGRQTDSAVMASMDDTTVFATVVCNRKEEV